MQRKFRIRFGFSRYDNRKSKIENRKLVGLVAIAFTFVLGGVLAHLVRNAIAHGIEIADDRERAGKPAFGSVEIRCAASQGGPVIEVSDDGAGFDMAALRAKGMELGLESEVAIVLAFRPGVTTASPDVRALAGQGMGLTAVQSELAALGYEIRVVATSAAGSKVRMNPVSSAH